MCVMRGAVESEGALLQVLDAACGIFDQVKIRGEKEESFVQVRDSLKEVSNVECRRNWIDFMTSLKFSRSVECLLWREDRNRKSEDLVGAAMEGLEIQSHCSVYSILFCVWFKRAVLSVPADCFPAAITLISVVSDVGKRKTRFLIWFWGL